MDCAEMTLMDKPRTIQGWRAAYAAVDRLLRGNYAELIGGEAVVLWLGVRGEEEEYAAYWESPEKLDGWIISPVTCDDALLLRRMGRGLGVNPGIRATVLSR